jgi:thiosulfate dehydrogenase [quinone] large subunit
MSTVLDRASVAVTPDLPAGRTSTTAALFPKRATDYVWAATRLALGWIFLWPFFDKLFGLGHETASGKAWIHGGSPTTGFLKSATGPFAGVYHSFAGAAWADWGFMLALVCIGSALLLGVGMRVAAVSGVALLVLMWSASLPPANNPFLDEHIIYALVLVGLALVGAGRTLGLGRSWANTSIVRRHPWLT